MWLEVLGGIDNLVFYIFCAVAALITLFGLITVFLPCCLPAIRGYSPGGTIDFYIILGGVMITVTVLMKGIDPEWANFVSMSAICQLYPAVCIIGFTMFFGGLFVKAATIYSYKWFHKTTTMADEWKPNLAMWGLLIVIGIVAAIWCVLFTPVLSEISFERYLCYNEQRDFEFKVATSVWHGLFLLIAVILMPLQCKASRKTPCSSESTALSWVIVNTLLAVIAGICIRFLYQTSATVHYAIIGGLTLWMVLFANIATLGGKVAIAKNVSRAQRYQQEESYDVIKEEEVSGETMEMDSSGGFVNKGFSKSNSK